MEQNLNDTGSKCDILFPSDQHFLQPTVNKQIEVQQFGATTADVEEALPVAASSLCSNWGKTCRMKQRHVSSEQDEHTASQHTSCSRSPAYKHIMWLFGRRFMWTKIMDAEVHTF